MGMLRCPTCLALLDGGEARCPACRTRLRKRSQPIVLGEKARLASRPQLQLDRELHQAEEAKYAEDRRRRRVAEATHRSAADTRPVTPRPTEPAEFVAELVWTPDAEPEPEAVTPEPAPQVAALDIRSEPEIVLEPAIIPEPNIELAALLFDEPEPEPEPEVITPAAIFAPIEREPVVPAQLFARANGDQEDEPEPRSLLFTSLTPTPTREPTREPAREHAAPERALEPELDDAARARFGLFDLTSDSGNNGSREEYRPTPSRSRRFIDLTADAEADAAHTIDLEAGPDKPTGESMHEMFEALHRKARAQDNETDMPVPELATDAKPPTSRALRLTGPRGNRRRRWGAEPSEGSDES